MRAGGGNRLGAGFLPGGDHHVGHPIALAGQVAFGVGFTVQARTQVIQGKVDNPGHAQRILRHHEVDSGRQFHKTTDDTAVYRGQYWVAQVFIFFRQTEDQIVAKAISQVSSLRGRLGAFQRNTLASAINSMLITHENVTAAESAIRDADFAVETSNLTRSQILVAASTNVLQLANAAPQNALALLG